MRRCILLSVKRGKYQSNKQLSWQVSCLEQGVSALVEVQKAAWGLTTHWHPDGCRTFVMSLTSLCLSFFTSKIVLMVFYCSFRLVGLIFTCCEVLRSQIGTYCRSTSIIAIRSPLQLCFALFKLVLWYVQLDSS